MQMLKLIIFLTSLILVGCQSDDSGGKGDKEVLWVYTSMYKDTIADLTPRLKKAFPKIEFKWYQAGSEDIATKVNAEMLAGSLQADVLISSDRFWYEEMANQGHLISYKPSNSEKIPATLKHTQGSYHTVSVPVMVLVYNTEAVKEDSAPKTFKEMANDRWKGKFTTGSPLASGTNFTTMAHMQHRYGWDYFKNLRANDTIAQGGNSSVLRRVQSKERPVGWVLLENVLRFKGKDERLKVVYPDDGVVTHSNVMAITRKEGSRTTAMKFADWMLASEGQAAMTRSYMYSPLKEVAPPEGAPPLEKILENSFPWSQDFIQKVTKARIQLKEDYAQIMFQ